MGKDIILRIIGDIGFDGASYCAMEFTGTAIHQLSVEERMTICNMAIEAGGKNGIIEPDEKTFAYVRARTNKPFEAVYGDAGAQVDSERVYDAAPSSPAWPSLTSPAIMRCAVIARTSNSTAPTSGPAPEARSPTSWRRPGS
jgi:3-isopropylmalate/(R)-2-methylmalate dehydratase large subunit